MGATGQDCILWCEDSDQFAATAADRVAAVLAAQPRGAVALPTGQTPVGMYRQLTARAGARQLDLGRAHFFNLDEYVGLAADHPLSYARFLQQHLLRPAAIPAPHVRLLRGDAADLPAEISDYERAIQSAGGLELAILGLGQNGHVAFNEPGSDWTLRTHLVQLTAGTRAVHHAQTEGRYEIPWWALTVGIATLRAARHIVLLVAGAKGEALKAWMAGVPDPRWPVTSLLGHPNLTLVCDAALQRATGGVRIQP